MVVKSEVLEAVKEFNKANEDVKAALLESETDAIHVSFSGPYCLNCGEWEEFPHFRELLEAKLKHPVNVRHSLRVGPQEHNVVYTIGDEDPADRIIKLLRQYEEGTPKRSEAFED